METVVPAQSNSWLYLVEETYSDYNEIASVIVQPVMIIAWHILAADGEIEVTPITPDGKLYFIEDRSKHYFYKVEDGNYMRFGSFDPIYYTLQQAIDYVMERATKKKIVSR